MCLPHLKLGASVYLRERRIVRTGTLWGLMPGGSVGLSDNQTRDLTIWVNPYSTEAPRQNDQHTLTLLRSLISQRPSTRESWRVLWKQKDVRKTQSPHKAFLMEDILACHNVKSTNVSNKKKKRLAEFNLAASVSATWHCACWDTCNTFAFPPVTSQDVRCKRASSLCCKLEHGHRFFLN